MAEDLMAQVTSLLKKDRSSRHSRFPSQASYAMADSRVSDAVRKRIDNHQAISKVKALEYDVRTGLNRIIIEFSPPAGISLSNDGILVILDADCTVVGLVDPFDPLQPNPHLPPIPEGSEVPFVLSRPSASTEVKITEEELYLRDIRVKGFFEQLAPRRPGGGGSGPTCDPDRGTTTTCQVSTLEPYNISCKNVTGFLVPRCDSWGTDYIEKVDTIDDDCGYDG
jgi:hypothetical protein